MPNSYYAFLAPATEKAANDLAEALLSLPEDKRNWSPASAARTALDQVAECALNNGYTAELIKTHLWEMDDYQEYLKERENLVNGDWATLHALLLKNTKIVIEAIAGVSEEDLDTMVTMPWGTQPLRSIVSYPYWNMSYHQGQIYYIGSILEGEK